MILAFPAWSLGLAPVEVEIISVWVPHPTTIRIPMGRIGLPIRGQLVRVSREFQGEPLVRHLV
jgi:hypothetical protein